METSPQVERSVPTAQDYADAAVRPNTKKAYAGGVAHFERWGGLLPAEVNMVRDYLADHASTLSISTLELRLAAVSNWHKRFGFPDPTKSVDVRSVMSGIRALHARPQKQAKVLDVQTVMAVANHLGRRIAAARASADRLAEMHSSRDRAILLLGFWRGLRMDEITKLRIEHVSFSDAGLTIMIGGAKTSANGEFSRHDYTPIEGLCPVQATRHWSALICKDSGPLFSKIDRWGAVSDKPLGSNSLAPLLRAMLEDAGVAGAADYSGHSLRRGLATYATSCNMTLKEVMQLVGWKDPKSALRYQSTTSAAIADKLKSGIREIQPEAPLDQKPAKPVLIWQSA